MHVRMATADHEAMEDARNVNMNFTAS
jgi:hypothetical protein